MKKISSMFALMLTVAVGLASLSDDVFAKRVGGGRSVGKQSEQVTQRQANPQNTASTPAASSAAAPAAAGGMAAAAQPARNRWLAPLAGLAAGLGLAALASHLGFGEQFGSMMTMILFAMIALFAFKFFMSRRKAAAAPAMRPAYAGGYSQTQMGPEASVQRFEPLQPAAGSSAAPLNASPQVQDAPVVLPAGFDAEGFLRQSKLHFIRLQASFDAANLSDLREFTSPEMFAELQMEIQERKGAANKTEVLQLDGEVIGVHSNSVEHMASVRFQGMLRENVGGEAERIDEVWNLTKPLSGTGGWVLAGIQQLS